MLYIEQGLDLENQIPDTMELDSLVDMGHQDAISIRNDDPTLMLSDQVNHLCDTYQSNDVR